MSAKKRKIISTGQPITEVPNFVNADGEYIFCRYWEPQGAPTALVCVVHGYGEHCGRYAELAKHLNDIGAYVFSHDCTGHGESEGDGWFLKDYNVIVRDVLQHVDIVREKFPNIPMFLFGHSLGGSAVILAAHERPELFRGVTISAPAILENKETATPFKLFLLRLVVKVFPRMSIGSVDPCWLTHDKEQIKMAEEDPLVVDFGMMAKTAETGLKMTEKIRSIIKDIEYPFLLTHGDGDIITNVDGSTMMHEQAKSEDKMIKIYPGLYHNLAQEVREDRIMHFNTIRDWIQERI